MACCLYLLGQALGIPIGFGIACLIIHIYHRIQEKRDEQAISDWILSADFQAMLQRIIDFDVMMVKARIKGEG